MKDELSGEKQALSTLKNSETIQHGSQRQLDRIKVDCCHSRSITFRTFPCGFILANAHAIKLTRKSAADVRSSLTWKSLTAFLVELVGR